MSDDDLTSTEMLDALVRAAFRSYSDASARSQQSRDGLLGPSDLGFCRQKAVLMTKGVEPTDSRGHAKMDRGIAIHEWAANALERMFGTEWECRPEPVTTTFPSGRQITGTPDAVATPYNALLDAKSKDGYHDVLRHGSSQSDRFQRHTYARGLLQAGRLDPTRPVLVGNIYIDRAGNEEDPLILVEELDPTLDAEIDSWMDDVEYAVLHDEDGSRDVEAPVCEKICEFFGVCRGGLPIHEDAQFIRDGQISRHLQMYDDGRDLENEGKRMKREASEFLAGINGTDGVLQVRWTQIQPTTIRESQRAGYARIDVRKARR